MLKIDANPFEQSTSDVVVGQRTPQQTKLVGVSPQTPSDDRIDLQTFHLVRIF